MPNTSIRRQLSSLFTHFGRALMLVAMGVCCRAAWCAEPQKHKPATDPKTFWRDFGLTVWVSKPTEELRLAAALLKLPVNWQTTPRDGLSWATIRPREIQPFAPSDHLRGSECSEGYEVAHNASGELILAAKSQRGLANGLYDARRALLVADTKNLVPAQLLPPGEHKPYFARRETYQFLTTWNLPRLTGGTFTIEQWKTHLQRMRSAQRQPFLLRHLGGPILPSRLPGNPWKQGRLRPDARSLRLRTSAWHQNRGLSCFLARFLRAFTWPIPKRSPSRPRTTTESICVPAEPGRRSSPSIPTC